jgi:hypothetical protein
MELTPMTFALVLMGLMNCGIVVLAICGAVIAKAAFQKTERGAARALSQMIERAGVLQLLTVQVIVMSVVTLRIIDGLSADATVSILSGIAGYVLGGLSQTRGASSQEPARPPATN